MHCEELDVMSAHEIFKLSAEPVRIELLNGTVICGNVYTVDPMTSTLVIFQFPKKEPFSVCVIPHDAFSSMNVVNRDEELPECCRESTPQLIGWMRALLGVVQPSSQLTSQLDERNSRKHALIKWLRKNGAYDAEEDGSDSIRVFRDVLIQPPYTSQDCFCENLRALASIQSSIKRFDAESSQVREQRNSTSEVTTDS
uniref:AD domain-containing protein n=1 Tax=Parascaris univalens TaxID=6257 RepID=A0A915CG15_PARUN